MKYKTAELKGALLDAAVFRARGVGPSGEVDFLYETTLDWSPSTNWADGGPIIEREQISLTSIDHRHPELDWHARIPGTLHPGWEPAEATGPTPLVAAMRAYVASKFGDEVDLP
jgi:hypothetical protein